MLHIQVSRDRCLSEAARQTAYITEKTAARQRTVLHSQGAKPLSQAEDESLLSSDLSALMAQESDEALLQQFWEAACREADVLLSRFRTGPSQGCLAHDYVAVLHMPPAFDPGLAPMLSGLLFSFFTTFITAGFVRISLPEQAQPLELQAVHLRQRIRDVLHMRRLPIRRPPIY